MPISAGNIIDKISELRSKVAAYEGLVLHLRSNYMSIDEDGEPELRFHRGDYAPVPEQHIELVISEIEALVRELREQQVEWESITVSVGEPAPKKQKKAAREGTST
jgi:hypothetical protein